MSFTACNGPILSGLLGDETIAAHLSAKAELAAMARFEQALAAAQAAHGAIGHNAAWAIARACETLRPDIDALRAATARDGVAVPEFVRQLRARVGQAHAGAVHLGVTSQDVIDTSMALRLRDCLAVLSGRLSEIDDALDALAARFGSRRIMARTRMQAALPVTARDRIAAWHAPIKGHVERLAPVREAVLRLQLGGPVGTREGLGADAGAIAAHMADALGLREPGRSWHADRTPVADCAHWLSAVTGSLGKIGQDMALMAQNGIDDIALADTGGSSAMPHKHNPVKAEILVTLARFNATQIAGMHHALAHEQERSGSAWTLEWMILPQMVVATGASTRTALALFADVVRFGGP